jgi:hypothetical protein
MRLLASPGSGSNVDELLDRRSIGKLDHDCSQPRPSAALIERNRSVEPGHNIEDGYETLLTGFGGSPFEKQAPKTFRRAAGATRRRATTASWAASTPVAVAASLITEEDEPPCKAMCPTISPPVVATHARKASGDAMS